MMYSIMLTEGDILDRLSILKVKQENWLGVDYLPFDRYIKANPAYESHPQFQNLLEINRSLWDLENRVREAHRLLDHDRVVQLSAKIIAINKKRYLVKQSLDGDNWEKKNYAG